ncbi:MAG: M23 family metallopeptidase [Paludibacteraceae bacterium]|nr:M23 family metallopeptidase [Paludibacteraceae bacterium]
MQDSLSFWQRIRIKRRISVMDDHTLTELWSFRISSLGLVILFTLLFVITLVGLSIAIVFTPVRNVLPGYNQNLRNQLMTQSERLDSLANTVELQRQYLSVIRDITAGEVSTDSVQPLDSLQLVFQEQLMQAKMEATEEFVEQYEQKEKDNMLLFDVQNVIPVATIFRPAHGVIVRQYAPQSGLYGVRIQTPDKENITAVLTGSIIYTNYELDNTYTVVMQHANYISTYRHIGVLTKQVGANLKAGETLGIVHSDGLLDFELWKEGQPINPEEVIAF